MDNVAFDDAKFVLHDTLVPPVVESFHWILKATGKEQYLQVTIYYGKCLPRNSMNHLL